MSLCPAFQATRGMLFHLFAASSVLVLAFWSPVLAQETTGVIQGRVTAPDGKPIADVDVLATMPSPRVVRTVPTDTEGCFRFTVLPLGEYSISIQDPKFEPATVPHVVVRLGQTAAVPVVKLQPLGSLVEQVEVVAKAPPIDPTSTATGGNVLAAFFENLPVTRDYQSIAMLLPNVTNSMQGDPVNFGGATGLENRYFVDGVDVTDPERGLGGTMLPPDFIQEVEVKAGGYEAEFRSALGGIVNVVTPSGSDRFSGKLIGYWTSHVVSQDPKQSPVALQQKDFGQYDVGFSVSGPLFKQRAWFFIAYDPQYQRVDTEIPGLYYSKDSSTTHRFSGKIDWQVNGSNSLALTVVGDPMNRDGVGDFSGMNWGTPLALLNPDPYLRHIETGGVGVSLRGTHVVSPRVLLESSISNLWRKDINLPATGRGQTELLFVDAPTGVWSGGSGSELDMKNSQSTAGLKATWSVRRHELKAGAEYRNNHQDIDHYRVDKITRYSDTSFSLIDQHARGQIQNRIASLFAQDSWRIGSRVVFNYGVRWAREDLRGESTGVVQHLNDEWQPRLGFIYQAGRLGTQRIYGSAARYYQELPTGGVSYWTLGNALSLCDYDHDPRIDTSGGNCLNLPSSPTVFAPFNGYNFYDYSLGYQRQLGQRHRVGVRGNYRTLGDMIEDGCVIPASGEIACYWGNLGTGPTAGIFPHPSRVYEALEVTVEGQPTPNSGYLASYVLSKNQGNYTGLYQTDVEGSFPGAMGYWDTAEGLVNADGPLPNDRTHALKGAGFYRFDSGLNIGASLLWESGTPLSEFGGGHYGAVFLKQRGTVGRTPSIVDLSLRLDYIFLRSSPGRWKPRLILDIYHLFSGRIPVDYDQVHYFNQDASGNQIDPNPTYGLPTRYYPPPTARLGLEVTF